MPASTRSGSQGALEAAGLWDKTRSLPEGMDSPMLKVIEDDGIVFSGAENQKLAIARSLFRNSDLIIMDGPTAALDPLAEAEVFEHFHELSQGRTAIFISHRMSSSTFCDRILLLQAGKVAAFDSHENLMMGHSLYRELFEAPARHFATAS